MCNSDAPFRLLIDKLTWKNPERGGSVFRFFFWLARRNGGQDVRCTSQPYEHKHLDEKAFVATSRPQTLTSFNSNALSFCCRCPMRPSPSLIHACRDYVATAAPAPPHHFATSCSDTIWICVASMQQVCFRAHSIPARRPIQTPHRQAERQIRTGSRPGGGHRDADA